MVPAIGDAFDALKRQLLELEQSNMAYRMVVACILRTQPDMSITIPDAVIQQLSHGTFEIHEKYITQERKTVFVLTRVGDTEKKHDA